jgi:diguanylate cyclase (GGDEF)-like protein/PAS domain S-box-containing protein
MPTGQRGEQFAGSSMATSTQHGFSRDQHSSAVRITANSRRQPLRILFVHDDAAIVERCLHELNSVQFIVNADVALNAEELAKRMGSQSYDLVVAQCPKVGPQGMQTMELLRQTNNGTPLIFVTDTLQRENVMESAKNGAWDCIEMDRIARLPMAVRRTLDEKNLRDERDRAEKELRHSKAHYRALVENSAYGMCRCSKNGKFLEVNQVLVKILGYTSREELLSVNLASDIILDPTKWTQLLERSPEIGRAEPVETDWKRKDGTTLRVRLSGRKVRGEKHALDGYGIIVEDVTGQRALEDQLRKQAASDALTGLANYRRLVEVLDSEITRSKRTGREFTLLFLDLDGLKKINDHYGHQTGSRALCRLANVLRLCCRSIDTAARYGGDEFALVLPETAAGPATLVARRICELFANDGEEPKLTVSVGVASYPQDAETIGPLLYAADVALYSKKSQTKESPSQKIDAEFLSR